MAAGYYGLVHGALLCLQGWLRMSADASSSCRMSPGQLAASHPALLSCLFSLLGATATEAVTAERIECLACEILCDVLGPGAYGDDPQQERTAVDAAMAALLSLRDVALTPGPAGAGVARCVASVASALAQRDVNAQRTFVNWNEELDDDEEAFYRDGFLMTGPAYLQQLQERIAAATAWQQAEGALFCLAAVADMLRGQDLCSPAGRSAAFLSSPFTCATAAAVVGAYAPWFECTPAAPLEGALRLLLHALCFPHSWHAAARAFKVLCMRCAARLCSAPVVQSLAAVAAAAVAPAPAAGQVASYVSMPLEDRQAIVEGLARVITLLNPQDVVDSALSIQQPHLARTQSIISHGSSTAAQGGAAAKQLLQHLADELQLMADRSVLEAVCEVYKRALQAARGSAKPLLTTLLTAVGELFTATQQAACLDVLSTIAEVQ
ncbi:hypothetical protein COO60DRAFT_1653821 [Scenedesmus sp. NREL 46B-D3]|nr:hypothetical protein COO60DRAFT_1653821 [Scenedesmus sp. NREL 46B-D3]